VSGTPYMVTNNYWNWRMNTKARLKTNSALNTFSTALHRELVYINLGITIAIT